jgi:hypothetical protein
VTTNGGYRGITTKWLASDHEPQLPRWNHVMAIRLLWAGSLRLVELNDSTTTKCFLARRSKLPALHNLAVLSVPPLRGQGSLHWTTWWPPGAPHQEVEAPQVERLNNRQVLPIMELVVRNPKPLNLLPKWFNSHDASPWNHLAATKWLLLLFQGHVLEASLATKWTFATRWTFEVHQRKVLDLAHLNNM